MAIEMQVGGAQDLDRIADVWQGLNRHFIENGGPFKARNAAHTFAQRKAELALKAQAAGLRLLVAWDGDAQRAVGFCISTAVAGGMGEVESIYVEASHRASGLGGEMMRDALRWMDQAGVARRQVSVYGGIERSLSFYEHHGFEARRVVMEWVGDAPRPAD